MYVPTDEQFWSKQDPSKPDIAFLKNHFYREGRLTEEQALFILQKCVSIPRGLKVTSVVTQSLRVELDADHVCRGGEMLRSEPNLLEVDAPITGECFLRHLKRGRSPSLLKVAS